MFAFDALEAGETEEAALVEDVDQLLAAAGELPWEQADTVGEGVEYRAESKLGDHASTLSFMDTVVHGCVMAAV